MDAITVITRSNDNFSQNVIAPSFLLFVGSNRTNAVVLYCMLSVSSLILHATFIAGIRKLCGWKSNFCFTLLLTLSLMCMLRFTTELIGSITALFYMDWDESQDLGITLGSLAWSPFFTVIVLNIVITFHRLAYTAFPLTAGRYLNKTVKQVTLAAVILLFLTTVVAMHTSLLGLRWVDGLMSYIVMQSRNPHLFFILNSLSNYFVGIINLTAYSILFVMLWRKKLISFSRNREMKMTLQVLCMVVCEVLFFLYWEFVHANVSDTWDVVLAEISNLLYFDVLVIPYLVLNGHFEISLIEEHSCTTGEHMEIKNYTNDWMEIKNYAFPYSSYYHSLRQRFSGKAANTSGAVEELFVISNY